MICPGAWLKEAGAEYRFLHGDVVDMKLGIDSDSDYSLRGTLRKRTG
jgi:hypothetical protein